MPREHFQKLEGVSRPTASNYLKKLEGSGLLRSAPLYSGRGRPKKLYMVNRTRYQPSEPRVWDFGGFLKPLVKLEEDFDLRYALGDPFSSSAYGRVFYHPPLQLWVEERGKKLLTGLYAPYPNVVKVHTAKEEMLARRERESGLWLLSPEDTVALCLVPKEELRESRYPVGPLDAASVLLRRYLVEDQGVDVPYLCKRAVEEGVTARLLELDGFLGNEYSLSTLDRKWRSTLEHFASLELETPPLGLDPEELETFVRVSRRYFESKPWVRFFGVDDLAEN
ncbi:hypothetical protein AKJ45_03620 [candidate division MSBL1 archaeon SCGC-AAA261F19]|uniref:Uncharacterized protein n=1 Tax=candidate division MSBL1 archaeon SCGC-AAA261F19 TaxID=1698275 RepID=A0A133V732_9EURY|nr:hypothetical protein AKJ45_03620 [candidate division MSBL1 archaeon SCGC-AAA261F19]